MEEEKNAQALVWKHIYGFADSMTLKCAIELGIADILHRHGTPMSLPELAAAIPLPSVDLDRLYRVMRYLVHMKLFQVVGEDGKYASTPASKLILKGEEKSLASFAMLQYYEMDAWHFLSAAVEGKTTPWEKCHGVDYREYFAKDSKANQLLSDAMTSHTSMVTEALVKGCNSDGILDGVSSLVDVGGSTGVAARAIAKAFPSVKCAVFDLPHVIATAPECPEVERIEGDVFVKVPRAIAKAFPSVKCAVFDLPHVIATAPECPEVERIEGDVFVKVPNTDVVFMKSVLHDWGDEDCIKILKKCKEAIPERGKLVIVDIVTDVESTYEFTGARLGMEMDMLVTVGGKERSKAEWEKLFKLAGYGRYKITPIVAIESIIEVFP